MSIKELWLSAAALVAVMVTLAGGQTTNEKFQISALAVNMSNIGSSAGTETVDITITRWTTPEERQRIISAAIEKGQDAMLRALQDAPSHGRFRIPGLIGPDPHYLKVGRDLRYAWQTLQSGGGRRIVIATDRYIGPQEARNQPRTYDYPFTLLEIHIDKNGTGEGKMAVATKINYDKKKNAIELEHFASEPVRLQNLTATVMQ